MKSMKKILSLFLAMAIMFSTLCIPAYASGSKMVLTAESSVATVEKDDEVTITVKVGASAQAIGAMQVQLVYDDTKLEYVKSENGELGNKFTSQRA